MYFAFAAVGALGGGVPLRRFAAAGCALLGALFVWALTAKVIPGLHPDYGRLPLLERVEYLAELAAHQLGLHRLLGLTAGALIGDEVPEGRVVIGAHRLVEADQVAGQVDQLADPLLGDVQLVRQLGGDPEACCGASASRRTRPSST